MNVYYQGHKPILMWKYDSLYVLSYNFCSAIDIKRIKSIVGIRYHTAHVIHSIEDMHRKINELIYKIMADNIDNLITGGPDDK